MVDDGLRGLLVAFVVATLVTPLAGLVARKVGAVDTPRARGLAQRSTPLLGGLAIFAGAITAALLYLPGSERYHAIILGAAVIAAVGALDDILELPPLVKLLGQAGAALILVLGGVTVDNFTLPFVHDVDLGAAGGPLTLIGLVAIMNAVNFTDGVDGLAAGVCAISAAAFGIIAFSLQRDPAGVLALITAGAALGFLVHNFHPAAIFMGDCGSNLLGLLLGAIIVEGSLKTNALVALFVPLVVLAVPFLDTTFVVLKRMKYKQPVYSADTNHFHHRFARIGFSQRRTVGYLYALDGRDGGGRRGAARRPLHGRPRHLPHRLDDLHDRGDAARPRRLVLRRLHARDPQAQALPDEGRAGDAGARHRGRDRA